MGSWLIYGLGSETEDLPGFVVMLSAGRGGQMQPSRRGNGRRDFCPASFKASNSIPTAIRCSIFTIPRVSGKLQRESIDAITALDQRRYQAVHDPEILTRISQYEMALRKS